MSNTDERTQDSPQASPVAPDPKTNLEAGIATIIWKLRDYYEHDMDMNSLDPHEAIEAITTLFQTTMEAAEISKIDELVTEVLGNYAEDIFTPATDADRKFMNKIDPNMHTRIHCSGIRHGLHQLRRVARELSAGDDLEVIHVPSEPQSLARASSKKLHHKKGSE